MPHNIELSEWLVNNIVDTITSQLRGGYLRILPGRGDGEEHLVEMRFSAAPFPPAKEGKAGMAGDGLTPTRAARTGVANWFRAYRPDGAVVLEGSAGVGEQNDLTMNSTAISQLAHVEIQSMIIGMPSRREDGNPLRKN